MSEVAFEKPVQNSVPKIQEEVAVGEDLEFQRKWWKFEGVMWWVFAAILLADLAGFFGRGPYAHAHIENEAMEVKYERVERSGTPSILDVKFTPRFLRTGQVKLFVSESIVDELGTQRVIPSPLESVVGNGGVTYSFSANGSPASVKFALQPSKMGIYRFQVQVPGSPALQARVVVMP